MKIGRQGKPKYSEKTCPTTNPTWLDPGSKPGRRGGKPATNSLSYGATTDAGNYGSGLSNLRRAIWPSSLQKEYHFFLATNLVEKDLRRMFSACNFKTNFSRSLLDILQTCSLNVLSLWPLLHRAVRSCTTWRRMAQ
jgi:hypothetical protein